MEPIVWKKKKPKKKAESDDEDEIDLSEQNEEFISEAREKVLAKFDTLEKKLWPSTYKELAAFIEKYCELKNGLDTNTIMAFMLHAEIIVIEPKLGFFIDPKRLLAYEYEDVADLMAEMNRLVADKEWKYGEGMVNETIISESTVLVLQKAIAYLRLNVKSQPNYKPKERFPVPMRELEVLMQKVAEECVAQIVVRPRVIIEELVDMKFLSVEKKVEEGEGDADPQMQKAIDSEKKVVAEQESDSDEVELLDYDTKEGERAINYSGAFLAGGSGAMANYLKPMIKFAVILLFWTSMLQMILPKMGGI